MKQGNLLFNKDLSVGDIAAFSIGEWADNIGNNKEEDFDTSKICVGIIVSIDRRCSEGEATYTAMCTDGKIRFFITEDTKYLLSKL